MLRKSNKQSLKWVATFVFAFMFCGVLISVISIRGQEPLQTSPSACSVPSNAVRNPDGEVKIFSSEELFTRLRKSEPVERPPNLKANYIFGTAVVDVVIDKQGRLSCIQPIEGHPLAKGAIVRALRKWKFRAFRSSGLKWSMVGRLEVPYDFR